MFAPNTNIVISHFFVYSCIMCSLVSTAHIIGNANMNTTPETTDATIATPVSESTVINGRPAGTEAVADNNDERRNNYVATTPKFDVESTSELSRYEKGEEDYDEAVARIAEEEEQVQAQNFENKIKPFISVVGMLLESFIGRSMSKRSATTPASEDIIDETTSTVDVNHEPDSTVLDTNNSTAVVAAAAVNEGRYIKGDPLNGYYDFLINEGSYKFWAVFQLVTAVIVIYSTFAAIYYSKVNPLTSEYEYVDYFGRSFNGRSLSEAAASEDNGGYLQRLLHGGWLGTAKHAMDFVLAAIEKVPQ